MTDPLVVALQILLVAFAVVGALELVGRARGRVKRSNTAAERSRWESWRRVARVIGLTGLLATAAGVITNAPAGAVVAAMGVALGGFVLFLIVSVLAVVGQRKD